MKPEELKSLLKSSLQKKPEWLRADLYTLVVATAVILSLLTIVALHRLLSASAEESEVAARNEQRFVYDVAADKFINGGSVKAPAPATKEEESTGELTTPDKQEPEGEKAAEEKTKEPESEKTEEAAPEEEPAKQAATDESGKPKIAIIIAGVGISKSSSSAVANLPSAMTLGISPYSHFADEIIKAAEASKREYLVEVPAEPKDYPISDPGPYSLLCNNQLVENLSHLEWALGRIKGASGALFPIDEKFSQCPDNAKAVFLKLAEMKLPLLLSTPSETTEPDSIEASGIISARSSVVIDLVIDGTAIDNNLADLEKAASEKGVAIGIARPYPISLKAVSKWAETLSDRGFKLIPISQAFENQQNAKE